MCLLPRFLSLLFCVSVLACSPKTQSPEVPQKSEALSGEKAPSELKEEALPLPSQQVASKRALAFQHFLKNWVEGRFEEAYKDHADNLVSYQVGHPHLPRIVTKASLIQNQKVSQESLENLEVELQRFVEAQDLAIAEYILRGSFIGNAGEELAFTLPVAQVLHYNSAGKIQTLYLYRDDASFFRQLKLMEPALDYEDEAPLEPIFIQEEESKEGSEAFQNFLRLSMTPSQVAESLEFLPYDFQMKDLSSGKLVDAKNMLHFLEQEAGSLYEPEIGVEMSVAMGPIQVARVKRRGRLKSAKGPFLELDSLFLADFRNGLISSLAIYTNHMPLLDAKDRFSEAPLPKEQDGKAQEALKAELQEKRLSLDRIVLGVEACDAYLGLAKRCIKTIPDARVEQFKLAIEDMAKSWEALSNDSQNGRDILEKNCEEALKTAPKLMPELCPELEITP